MANWATRERLGDSSTPEWQQQNLTWIEPVKGQRWQVYKPAAKQFEGLLTDLAKLGYMPTSSGGYNYRNIRGSDRLSQHAFGTAIDLNALTNQLGQNTSDIPQAAQLARKHGLEWGGNWKGRPDPMHFEYTGGTPYDSPVENRRFAGLGTAAPENPLEDVSAAVADLGGQPDQAAPARRTRIENVPNPPTLTPSAMASVDPKRQALVAMLMRQGGMR